MKRNFKVYILLSMLGLMTVTGCKKFLEKQPDDMKTDEMIWSSRKETEAFLHNVYASIPKAALHQDDPWLGLSDEIDLSWNVYHTYPVNLGNWNTSSTFYDKWGVYYKAIRASLVFENNVDKNFELSDALKSQYKAESKFLRGYYYWLLLRQYGPVVLIKSELPLDTDWGAIPRSPYDECVDYIVGLMEEAEGGLPLDWQSDKQWLGKPNKVVCRAVKAQVLTMAASPQWNGNIDYANFKNQDGTQLVKTSYDEAKWKRAADASYAVIQLAESNPSANVRLYKNNENGDGVFSAYKSVRDVQIKRWNSEIIWGRSEFYASGWEIHTSPGPNNLGGVGPTQRVVDAFLMKNGRAIEDPQSGYVETGFATTPGDNWNPKGLNISTDRVRMIDDIRSGDAWGHWVGDWNMYANREPRFYAAILYNKRIIPQLPADVAKRDYYSTAGQQNGYGRAELYFGGVSRSSGSYTFYSRTGYLALKNVDPQSNMRDRVHSNNPRTEIFIRYAQVLLDYIEALNEYDPNNADIGKYWNMIRQRAGVPEIFTVYPEIRGDKSAQREQILKERQIELCFETDRYFTSRRRWRAHTPDNGDPMRKWGDGGKMWGMDINAGTASTNNFNTLSFYNRVAFEERVFPMKFNLFPIRQTEIDKNPALVQNPGW
jgi:hypothetical protein